MNRETATIKVVNRTKAATEHPRIFLGQPMYCLRHPYAEQKFPDPAYLTEDRAIEAEYLQWLRGQWNAKDRTVRNELFRLMEICDKGVLEISWSSRVHKLQAKILAYALTQMRNKFILGHVEMKTA